LDALNGIETLKNVRFDGMTISKQGQDDDYDESGLIRLCQQRDQQSNNNNANDLTLGISDTKLSTTFMDGILGANSRVTSLELLDITGLNRVVDTLENCLPQNSSLKRLQLQSTAGPPDPLVLQQSPQDYDDNSRLVNIHRGLGMLRALQGNQTLNVLKLDICCHDSFEYASDLASAVNQIPSLEELVLEVTDTNARRRISNAASFVQQLAHNKTIVDFHFNLDFGEDEIASAEAKATFKQKCCEDINKSLEVAMETNDTLQEISITFLDFQEVPLHANVQFWKKLNQLGRKQLTANLDDRKLWANVLIDQRENPDITYHLMSLNLPVWALSPKPPTSVSSSKRSRDKVGEEDPSNGSKKRILNISS